MRFRTVCYCLGLLVVVVGLAAARRLSHASSAAQPEVSLLRTPDGGIQPQAVVDAKGVLHLIYFKGDPGGGDVFYSRLNSGAGSFTKALRVNSRPGSVIATGSVRGAQMAVGRRERVYVAWMGSDKAGPRGPAGATPMLFTRLNDEGTAFEPQRNLMQFATGLDGGSSVAADPAGNVYVVWHADAGAGNETARRVWMARSTDDGTTFSREAPAYQEPTGACGCCGMRAFADRQGAIYVLYRAATGGIDRDMVLLASRDQGRDFQAERVGKWKLNACPMSTSFLTEGGARVLAAWETAGQVFYAEIEPASARARLTVPAPGDGGDRKHPALAANARGETLLAWTEGTGWARGGSLAWQVFDEKGRPSGQAGRAAGVPVWGLVAAFTRPDGRFTIIY